MLSELWRKDGVLTDKRDSRIGPGHALVPSRREQSRSDTHTKCTRDTRGEEQGSTAKVVGTECTRESTRKRSDRVDKVEPDASSVLISSEAG